jgi:integrase
MKINYRISKMKTGNPKNENQETVGFGYYISYYDENQIRKQIRSYGDGYWSYNEAEEAAKEKLIDLFPKEFKNKKLTFSELFKKYVGSKEEGNMKDRCIYDMKKVVNTHLIYGNEFHPGFENTKVIDITPEVIDAWHKALLNMSYQAGQKDNKVTKLYSDNQIKKIQVYFKSILSFAVKQKIISSNPFETKELKRRKELNGKRVFNIIDDSQYIQLYKEIQKTENQLEKFQYSAIFSILYSCGLRKGELLALTVADYNTETKILTINKSRDHVTKKTTPPKSERSYRIVKVCDDTHKDIMNLLEYYKTIPGYSKESLLISFDKFLSSSTLTRRKDEYFKAANLERIRLHDFRHSHVSYLANLSYTAFQIGERIGDTAEIVDRIYAHLLITKQDEMVRNQNIHG